MMGRFKLYGSVIEGQEANTEPLTRAEQRALPTLLVYETDDQEEAARIQQAGGFFRDRDTFISVTSVVDTGSRGSADAQPMPQKGE